MNPYTYTTMVPRTNTKYVYDRFGGRYPVYQRNPSTRSKLTKHYTTVKRVPPFKGVPSEFTTAVAPYPPRRRKYKRTKKHRCCKIRNGRKVCWKTNRPCFFPKKKYWY